MCLGTCIAKLSPLSSTHQICLWQPCLSWLVLFGNQRHCHSNDRDAEFLAENKAARCHSVEEVSQLASYSCLHTSLQIGWRVSGSCFHCKMTSEFWTSHRGALSCSLIFVKNTSGDATGMQRTGSKAGVESLDVPQPCVTVRSPSMVLTQRMAAYF